jgi:hypothetical protein
MPSATQTAPASRISLWAGRILSGLPVLLFAFTGMFGLLKPDGATQGAIRYGYAPGTLMHITIVELACAAVYAIPRTSVLGAVLMTGYLGGATATHVRVGELPLLPIIVGVVFWAGLFLREERLRRLIPLRR